MEKVLNIRSFFVSYLKNKTGVFMEDPIIGELYIAAQGSAFQFLAMR